MSMFFVYNEHALSAVTPRKTNTVKNQETGILEPFTFFSVLRTGTTSPPFVNQYWQNLYLPHTQREEKPREREGVRIPMFGRREMGGGGVVFNILVSSHWNFFG
jgi:hypothetical protein